MYFKTCEKIEMSLITNLTSYVYMVRLATFGVNSYVMRACEYTLHLHW
jgi:hypothetical protein